MTKTELLEIWGFLEILRIEYRKDIDELLKNDMASEEIKAVNFNHYKRIVELQKRITEETEKE